MTIILKHQFVKQIEKLVDKKLKSAIIDIINKVESCNSYTEIQDLKKLKGYKNFYRIRTGDYRIGIKIENNTVTFPLFFTAKTSTNIFPELLN